MGETRQRAAALKYVHNEHHAPRLVAKGSGAVAQKIIELARANGIPIREDRILVEALAGLDLYEAIPPELYRAVAEILAFLYAVSRREAQP